MISFEKKPSSKLLLEVLIENKEDCIEFPFELKQIKLPED